MNGGKQVLDLHRRLRDAAAPRREQGPREHRRGRAAASSWPPRTRARSRTGIGNIIQEITTRSTSFSVATISTLQTTAGRAVIVPRFDPGQDRPLEGAPPPLRPLQRVRERLRRSATARGAGDLDCDGHAPASSCRTSARRRPNRTSSTRTATAPSCGTTTTSVPCTQAPLCAAPAAKACASSGSARRPRCGTRRQELADRRSGRAGSVYTVVDRRDGDGQIDGDDDPLRLDRPTTPRRHRPLPGRSATRRYGAPDRAASVLAPQVIRTSARDCASGAAGCSRTQRARVREGPSSGTRSAPTSSTRRHGKIRATRRPPPGRARGPPLQARRHLPLLPGGGRPAAAARRASSAPPGSDPVPRVAVGDPTTDRRRRRLRRLLAERDLRQPAQVHPGRGQRRAPPRLPRRQHGNTTPGATDARTIPYTSAWTSRCPVQRLLRPRHGPRSSGRSCRPT